MEYINNNDFSWKRRIILWSTGMSSYYALTWVYDYIVISGLLLYFGLFLGSTIGLFLSIVIDLLTIKFYDWLKKDWLALETLKDLERKKNLVGKLFNFVRNKSTFITVIVLSLTSNAFVVTTYLRHGAYQYNGLSKRDWMIFLSSSLLINLYWIFVIMGGIEIIKYFYKLIISYLIL